MVHAEQPVRHGAGREWICVGGRGDGDRIPPTLNQIHYYLLVASHQVFTIPFTSSHKD